MNLTREIWLRSHSTATTIKVMQLCLKMVKVWPLKKAAVFIVTKVSNHLSEQLAYNQEMTRKMWGMARIFMGYEGALECPGRDSEEFFDRVIRDMLEAELFFKGIVPPRVAMQIALNNPQKFPLDNLQARGRLLIVTALRATQKHGLKALLLASAAGNIYLLVK